MNINRYQVKYQWEGETKYGIVDRYGKEAKKYALENKLVIADAIIPQSYVVLDEKVIDIPLDYPNEYDKHILVQFEKAQKLSDSLSEGVHVGNLFSIGVADGLAYYVVTKINKKTCAVEWRGFCPDRYTDHHFGWGGSFPISDIARYVCRTRGLSAIFARKD